MQWASFLNHHRPTDSAEEANKEVKRRTRVACLFPNTESLLRLAASVVMEISEDWESGRIYLNMDTE